MIFNPTLFVDQDKKFRGFQKLLQPETRQAVMLIQATKDMGKTWLAGKMHDYCQSSEVGVHAVYIDFRHPQEDNQDFLGVVRLIRDKLGAPAYFNQLNDAINSFSDVPVTAATGLGKLRDNLVAAFNLDEIRAICLDLAVNYEVLSGDNLVAKSLELILYCQRRSLLPVLLKRCVELRANVAWWDGLEQYQAPAAPAAVPAAEDAVVVDNNSPLRVSEAMERRRAERQINQAFFQGLAALMADRAPIAMLFDSFEAIKPNADRWLRDELLPRIRDRALQDVVVVITGRQTPDLAELNMQPLLVQTGLDPFSEEYVREYFEERRQVKGLDWRTIAVTSGGVPGALAVMADHAMAISQAEDDFFND